MRKSHFRNLMAKPLCFGLLLLASCASVPRKQVSPLPAPTSEVCNKHGGSSRSFDGRYRQTFDGDECFRRAVDGDPIAMKAIYDDFADYPCGFYARTTETSLCGLIDRYKNGDSTVRERAASSLWSLWACSERVSAYFTNPTPDDCRNQILSGNRLAAATYLRRRQVWSAPASSYLERYLEAVSIGERTTGCFCGTLRQRGAEECGLVARQVA